VALISCFGSAAFAAAAVPVSPTPVPDSAVKPVTSTTQPIGAHYVFIRKFKVQGGGHLLSSLEMGTAIYPYLGPYRTPDDVEQARAALEKAYREKGYQTVSVQIPPQQVRKGIVYLRVVKGEIGRLRIEGSRYYSIDEIRREVPSLQEGTVPNFNDVTQDLVVLNQLPDRRISPVLQVGSVPGTVDVNLNVKDTLPVHGSLEVNNRYSADTTPLRINGSVDYDNLWQLGHVLGTSFQLAPEDVSQVKVFSGYYLARLPEIDWLSLMLEGTDQDSNVNTLGGIAVAGKGQTVGMRAVFALPQRPDFYHSISLGLDYKHYDQDILIAGTHAATPLTYYPLSAAYSATWIGIGYQTNFDPSVTLELRGIDGSSSEVEFDNNRHGAEGSFIYFRGDLSHTRDLPAGFQAFGKIQGQASGQPLVNSEQFSGGGLGTVRGYLESEELGDNALFGTVEMRTPSLGTLFKEVEDWRFYVFGEGGILGLDDVLPEQQNSFTLASIGAGTRVRLLQHLNGSFDLGVPLEEGPNTKAGSPLLTFRVWGEF
jgi:hemolysin activation/secretion protein